MGNTPSIQEGVKSYHIAKKLGDKDGPMMLWWPLCSLTDEYCTSPKIAQAELDQTVKDDPTGEYQLVSYPAVLGRNNVVLGIAGKPTVIKHVVKGVYIDTNNNNTTDQNP